MTYVLSSIHNYSCRQTGQKGTESKGESEENRETGKSHHAVVIFFLYWEISCFAKEIPLFESNFYLCRRGRNVSKTSKER